MPLPVPLLLRKPRSALALTVSANEIADLFGVSRFTNTQGDGLTFPNKSVGIWPAATNRAINGNATTNTTSVTDVSSTTTRVTSATVLFGSTAFSTASSNLVALEGPYEAISGGAASTQYTVSVWVWAPSGSPTVRVALYDDVSGKQASAAVTLSATPQRISVTATTGAGSVTFRGYVETNVQQNVTFRWGGLQIETGPKATPYVETDGGTATRSAGQVQVPNAQRLFTPTTGYAAFRLRMGYASATTGTGNNYLWNWQDDGSNAVECLFDRPNNIWASRRRSAGVGNAANIAPSFALGDLVTVIQYWEANNVGLSIDGSAWTVTANTSAPTLTATTADIGSLAAATTASSSILWAVFGRRAPLTAADAVWFDLIGDGGGVPQLYECPGEATMVWDGRNAVAVVRG